MWQHLGITSIVLVYLPYFLGALRNKRDGVDFMPKRSSLNCNKQVLPLQLIVSVQIEVLPAVLVGVRRSLSPMRPCI